MIVEERDLSLTHPWLVNKDKIKIVLDWLLEFHFSTIDLLAERIGQKKTNANRFFNKLISDGLVQVF